MPRPTKPTALAAGASADDTAKHELLTDIYKEDIKNYVRRQDLLQDNLGRTYDIVWGQCTPSMRSKVESLAGYNTVYQGNDVIGLLKLIKLVTFDYTSQKNPYTAVIEVEKPLKTSVRPGR